MLQRRLLGGRRRIGGVSVLITRGSRAVPVDADPETVAIWAERGRRALQPPTPRGPNPGTEPRTAGLDKLRPNAELLAGLEKAAAASRRAFDFGRQPDTRTREEYDEQVEAYVGDAAKAMPGFVLRRMFDRGLGLVTFLVRYDTDDPIRGLQVQVHIPADGVMALDHGDLPDVDLPRRRPAELGKGGRDRFAGLDPDALSGVRGPAHDFRDIVPALGRGVRIDNTASVALTFDSLDLLPRDTVELAEVRLFTSLDHAGTSLAADWTARSLDASGVLPGKVDIPVDAQAPTIEELIAEPAEPTGAEGDDEDDGG